jgi:undecaprenyl-diphosphatase
VHVSVARLIELYGYWIVFAFVAVESLGIPLPGETALVTAAALAALGHLSLTWVIVTAAAGAVMGDATGYWVGRKGGLRLLRRYGRVIHFDEAKIDRVRAFFISHGPKAVFLGRFVALLRTWTAILAGTAEMPYGVFTFYNVLGGVTWAALFGTLGYVFGRSLPLLERYIGQASLAAVLLAALSVGLWLAWKWFSRNRDVLVKQGATQWGHVALRFPRTTRFAVARFAREEYLGLHLTAGLLMSIAGLWLFAGVTEDVVHHDPLTQFDLTMLASIRDHSTAFGDAVFQVVSSVGSPGAMAAVGIAGVILTLWRRDWLMLTGWIVSFAGAGLLSAILKIVIKRPRPAGAAAFLHGDTFSFPSGHALGSLVGFGMVAYLIGSYWLSTRRSRSAITFVAAFLIVSIGISRLYLGVHYFSDVVGGYAAGMLWLSACISGIEIARGKHLIESAVGATSRQTLPR